MTTQTIPMARASNLFWLWWTLAGLAGFVGGMTIKTAIEIMAALGGWTAMLDAIPFMLFGTLLGAMLGISTGLAQWLALRRRLVGVGAWVGATFGASTLFWTIHNSGVLPFAHTPWGLVGQGFGHGALLGATFGAAHYLVLRGRVPNAAQWVLISAASYSLAGAIMHWLLDVALALPGNYGPVDILIVSVVSALFSGIALQRLLTQVALTPLSARTATPS